MMNLTVRFRGCRTSFGLVWASVSAFPCAVRRAVNNDEVIDGGEGGEVPKSTSNHQQKQQS